MEKLQCKACGSYSMVPMDVVVEDDEAETPREQERETRFYTCHVCGDNWLSVKETATEDCTITFVHQMGMQPELKRIAHTDTPVVVSEGTIDRWEYFLDNQLIDADAWHEKLSTRRKILKSICSN
jgi:hypothetical protein